MKKLLPPLIILLSGGCTHVSDSTGAGATVEVIAHRGVSAYAPENTLAAFKLAEEMNADWFELDVRVTKDNQLIVIHDDNLDRIGGGNRRVADLDIATLQQVDAGSWFGREFGAERLPSLEETFNEFNDGDIGIYVELKADAPGAVVERVMRLTGAPDALMQSAEAQQTLLELVQAEWPRDFTLASKSVDLIRDHRIEKHAVIQTFSPVACAVARALAPEFRVEMLINEDEDHPERWGQLVAFGRWISVDGFNAQHEALTQERLVQFQAWNKKVAAWTVDDPAVISRLASWGIDGIITNKPDLCLQILGRD